MFDSRLQPVALERTLDGVSDVRLPATGEYLVALALDPSVDSAIFSWAAYDFADAGVLTLGVDAQGSLAPDESPQLYQVTLPDVGSYSFQSLHTPGAYGGWTLLDEDLNALWQQDLDQSYGQVIVATGPYYLLLENFDVVVKDFTIQVSRTDDDEGAAVVGQVVSGDIAAPGQRDVLSLDVLAGQQLLFAPIDLYVDSGWYNTRFDITVLDAAGREIRGLVPPESDPPRVYTVPEDSTYSIQFYSLDGETGGYAFQVLDLATAALITLDQVETVSLTEQGQRAAVKFDAVQGQRLWFDSRDNDEQYDWYDTWNYSWWLYGPGNSDGSSFYLGTDALLNIPMTGTYYVVFRSELTEAVDVDFMVMNGSNAAPLGVGDTLSDSLTNDFETKLYRLPINSGQTLWLDHLSVTGLDGFETVPWKLLSATGTAVVSSSLGTDAAVHRNAADELLLVVSGEAYANTVNYDLHVLDAATATALTLDADISGALETGRTTHLYRLDGGTGQRLWFENLVDGLSGIQWRLMRTVSGSGGTLLSTMFNTSMAADQAVELPVDGTYFLAIEGRGSDDPLDYSFRLNTPVETSQTLAPGTRVMGNIVNPGDQVVYSFHAEPGQFFVIDDLDTNGYYFPFTLQLPDGSEEDLNYSSAEPFLVTQSGTHQLTVSGRNLQTGEFALELVDLQVAPQLTLGEELAGRLNPSGESDVFQFTGARNQRLVLDYVSVDGGANWSLFTSSGAAVTQDRFLNTDVLVTLPEDGTYYLLVYGRNPGGSPVNYQFVMRETLTVSEQLNVGPGGGGPERFAYDPTFNQLVFYQDSLGRITTFALDETNGNVLESRRVIGQPDSESDESDDQVFNFTYGATGQIDTITDPLGRITDYEYDAQGRLQSVTLAMGTVDEEVMQYEYDAAGNPTAVIDANLNRTEFTFDDLNRLVRITEADPDGGGPLTSPVTEFAYDANGNIEVVTDAGGSTKTNAYDSLNRLIMSTDEQGNQTQYTYDSAGNLISIVDPLGDTSTNEYDSRNRITSNVDPNGAVTRFLYDFDNNLVGIVDSVGNETQFDYDAQQPADY